MKIIYKHTSPSGLSYIGQSKYVNSPNKRWLNGEGYITNAKFYCAILLYGWDNFTHEIIEIVEDNEADEREQYWAEYYNSNIFGYNLKNEHPLYGKNPACHYFEIVRNNQRVFGKVGQKLKKEDWETFQQSKWFKWNSGEEYDAWLREWGELAIINTNKTKRKENKK